MEYAYPKLSEVDLLLFRAIGPGLGNLLFPWARALVGAKKNNMELIWPTWPQFKIGTILRNEKDKRLYTGLFKATHDYKSGLDKVRLMCTLDKIDEGFWKQEDKYDNKDRIIVFSGMDGYFSKILTEYKLVREELIKITRDNHKVGMSHSFDKSITVHIRLGDFIQPESKDILLKGSESYRIPISWYVEKITLLRNYIGYNIPVFVFSDGSDEELLEVMNLPEVKRITFKSSIADLLSISCSNILIASGSTFSMWGSYLGRMPVIWYKGQLRQKLYYEESSFLEIESDEGEELPLDFIEYTKELFC